MKFKINGPFTPFPGVDDEPYIYDYKSFWQWFIKHECRFRQMLNIDSSNDCEFKAIFASRLLLVWEEGAFYGGHDENGKHEITFSLSTQLRRAVYAEEIVAAAPVLEKWRFSVFTKPLGDGELKAEFNGILLSSNDVYFFSTEHAERPDMVDITVVYKSENENHQEQMILACKNFIQRIVGELEMLTQFDKIDIRPAIDGDPELIPIAKLSAFLRWRQQEFVEKYKGVYYKKPDTEYGYATLQSEPADDLLISVATADHYAMRWNETCCYPFILIINYRFKGMENGQPDESTIEFINRFQNDLTAELVPRENYLFLVHVTQDSVNTTYIACNEFRDIAKIIDSFLEEYGTEFTFDYGIMLDKYWSVVDTFRKVCLTI